MGALSRRGGGPPGRQPDTDQELVRAKADLYAFRDKRTPGPGENGMDDAAPAELARRSLTELACMPGPHTSNYRRLASADKRHQYCPPGAPVPIGNFVAVSADGTKVRSHPNQTTKRIAAPPFAFQGDLPCTPNRS